MLLSLLLELWPTQVLTTLTMKVTILGKFFMFGKSWFLFYINLQKLWKFIVNHFTCLGKQFEQNKYCLFCLSFLIIKVIRLPIQLSQVSENTKVLQLKIYLERLSNTPHKLALQVWDAWKKTQESLWDSKYIWSELNIW